jgi:tellurite resistance protein TerC
LQRFTWIIYVFGAVLIVTGIKMLTATGEERFEPEKNPIVKIARKLFPFTPAYEDDKFFVKSHAGWYATPLFLVLIFVEWTDLVFAIDSIPAVFAVTNDPFVVYSSNVFAILGLRALFFLLAGMLDKFHYLKPGVALVLVFVGIKMVASRYVHLPIQLSLGIIIGTLTLAILLSIWRAKREAAHNAGVL